MRKVCFIGHFGFGRDLLNGQTVKTKVVANEVEKKFGKDEIVRVDTHGGLITLIKLPFALLYAVVFFKNVIVMPAHNGLRIIAPLLVLYNQLCRKKLHYVVVGGWLPDFLATRSFLSRQLKKLDWIYVETEIMKNRLNANGFNNVCVMPNFKRLSILDEKELVDEVYAPFRFCTFSRVMKEKGIEDAVNAICQINERTKTATCVLDIYGKVDENQQEWFNDLVKNAPKEISYKGCAPFDKSVETLKGYYALLFPTYYNGEGFAGTLLDAFAAGVPVIASDWRYNAEIVDHGVNGYIFKTGSIDDLVDKMLKAIDNRDCWMNLKKNCVEKALAFSPENVIGTLISKIG